MARHGRPRVQDAVQTPFAGPAEAELLAVETGHPLLLLLRRLGLDGDGPVERTRSAYRGDRFRFVARARRVGGPARADRPRTIDVRLGSRSSRWPWTTPGGAPEPPAG